MPVITREQIDENIDENISNVITEDGITPVIDGDNRKLMLDYVDYQDSLKANTEDLGATAFSNDYNDLDNLPTIPSAKTSGAVTLNGIFQVLPYDINSCSFSGGKAFLPTTTENGRQILVIATANNIEIRANESGTNRMFETFNTFTASVTLFNNEIYRFTYIGFGGYWKAEYIGNTKEKKYKTLISQSGTSTPTKSDKLNTTGLTYSISREGVGVYRLTPSATITSDINLKINFNSATYAVPNYVVDNLGLFLDITVKYWNGTTFVASDDVINLAVIELELI